MYGVRCKCPKQQWPDKSTVLAAGRSSNKMSELHSHSPSKSRVEWSRWHFDIDNYLNRFIPGPPWRWVPRPISHFFGYRGDQPPRAIGNLVIAFWALIGVFCGVSVTMSVSMRVPSFKHHNAPLIIASMVCSIAKVCHLVTG